MRMQPTSKSGTKVFAIVLIQTLGPHVPAIHRQPCQQVDGAMPIVIKFLAFNPTRLHELRRMSELQNLQVGLFIARQKHLTVLPQAFDPLVIPKDFERPLNGLLVPDRGFPVARLMRLQIGRAQNLPNRGVVDGLDIFLLNHRLRQTSIRPMGYVPIHAGRFATG
jgi:hypothetical protein